MSRPAMSADVAELDAPRRSFFDSTIVLARNARPQGPRGDQLAIALGYLERLRLGLGSPFRLADEALADPRLERDDAAAASRGRSWPAAPRRRLRRRSRRSRRHWPLDVSRIERDRVRHLALIEHAVDPRRDPRAGELAVRLAYTIAAAKGTISSGVALARRPTSPRSCAIGPRRDPIFAICSATRASSTSTCSSCSIRGARTRVFRVEQPALASLPADLQIEAMRAVPAHSRGDRHAGSRRRDRETGLDGRAMSSDHTSRRRLDTVGAGVRPSRRSL